MEYMTILGKRPFLDYLCDDHVIIISDWVAIDTSITHALYILNGITCPPYDRHTHKGESNTS